VKENTFVSEISEPSVKQLLARGEISVENKK